MIAKKMYSCSECRQNNMSRDVTGVRVLYRSWVCPSPDLKEEAPDFVSQRIRVAVDAVIRDIA